MIFRDKERDLALQQEIINNQIYRTSDFQSFATPDEGDLLDVIRANASKIDGKKWVHWLIKDYEFTRYDNPKVDRDWARAAGLNPEFIDRLLRAGTYPMGMSGRSLLVGVSRPDRKDVLLELKQVLSVSRIFCVALTPTDMCDMHAIYQEFLPQQ